MTGDASKPAVLVEEGKRPLWPTSGRWRGAGEGQLYLR